jgi:RNA polymerase sigma-70 factor (ECF subfamily)
VDAKFATTRWSQVLAAGEQTGTEFQKALTSLCEVHWYPLYAYLRSQGPDPEESRDLTQAYFDCLLEKNILEDVDPSAGRFLSLSVSRSWSLGVRPGKTNSRFWVFL